MIASLAIEESVSNRLVLLFVDGVASAVAERVDMGCCCVFLCDVEHWFVMNDGDENGLWSLLCC